MVSGTTTNFLLPDLNTRLAAQVTGVLSGTGNLVVDTPGVVTLSAANTFTGTTTVTAGTLRLDNANAIAQSEFGGGAGSLSFGGVTSATFAGLSGNANILLSNTGNAAVALTVGGNNREASFSGTLSGNGAFTKIGTGTLTLDQASTYSGITTIGAGMLRLGANGSFANSGTVVVGNAGNGAVLDVSSKSGTFAFGAAQVLKGEGTIKGSDGGGVFVSVAGLLSPGNRPGILTFNDTGLSLEATSNTLMEITGTTEGTQYDVVRLTGLGELTYGGTLTLNFSQTFADNTTFNLLQFASGNSYGSFDTVVSTGPSYAGTFTKTGSVFNLTSGGQTLTFTPNVAGTGVSYGQLVVVPEPLTLGLFGIGGGAALLGLRRLRRRGGRRTAFRRPG